MLRPRGGARACLSLSLALVSSGCANLLGIDDRSPDDASALDVTPADQGVSQTANSSDASTRDAGVDATRLFEASTPGGALDASDVEGSAPDAGDRATDSPNGAPRDATATPDVSAPMEASVRDAMGAPDVSVPSDASRDAADGSPPSSNSDAMACPDPCDMADGLNLPFVMTSDAYNVYWVDFGDKIGAGNGVLKSCAVDGCNGAPAVWHTGLMDPRGIAVDASNVYWGTTWGGVAGAVGAIWSCALSFGPQGCATPTRLASALDPDGIAIDAAYVYWADPNRNTINRVSNATPGQGQVLYGVPDAGLGVFRDSPSACAVDNAYLYIIDGSGNVYWMPKAGGTPRLLHAGSNILGGIAVDGLGSAFFGENQQIFSGDSSGPGSVVSIVMDGVNGTVTQPVSLAIDILGRQLYWADWGTGTSNDGAIGRVMTNGAAPLQLQTSLVTPESITVSGAYAYWISAGTPISTSSTTTTYVQAMTGKLWRTHK